MSEHKQDQHLIWHTISASLKEVFGENAYRGWLKSLRFEEDLGGKIILSVPTPFVRDWIQARYLSKLLGLWQERSDAVHAIEVITNASVVPSNDENPEEETAAPVAEAKKAPLLDHASGHTPGHTYDHTSGLDPRFTFENFVVGKPNELAYAAARRVAETDQVNFNPLFLYGGVGLGKTHLMHAVAWHLHMHRKDRRVIYMSAEKFMYQFIRALRNKNIIDFREYFRSVDVLMIDDVQFISGKDSTQEEFFHTFNALVDQKKQIILSADKSPSEMQGIEERMRSRLGWGLVADIHPTSYELRLGILQSKVEKLEVAIPAEVLEFLAHKITSNIRELEGALNRILAHVTLVGGRVTLETTRQVLKDLLRANERHVTIEDIQRQVAEHFNVRTSDMHSPKRLRSVARPRQVAMYLSKQLTTRSLPEIGRKFGGRDHTTVMHAVKKVEELKLGDATLRNDIELLSRMLSS
jgi:chromosomal replication initiator protein